jgi:hypothetical protein
MSHLRRASIRAAAGGDDASDCGPSRMAACIRATTSSG